jgi:hypothetical protein
MKLYVGQAAPDFTLPSQLDKEIKLSDYLGKNVVLVFFPLEQARSRRTKPMLASSRDWMPRSWA